MNDVAIFVQAIRNVTLECVYIFIEFEEDRL